MSLFPFSPEEHLPGVLCLAGLFSSVPGSLAPLDLRRQRQLQLLLRHNSALQRGAGRMACMGARGAELMLFIYLVKDKCNNAVK